MVKPTVEPSVLCLKVAPGGSRSASLSVPRTPASGKVTATVVGGGDAVRLQRVTASVEVRRALTEEEIQELPPFPPSIRENARRKGILEHQDLGSSDGVAPLDVPAGAKVSFLVEVTVPATTVAGDVIEARLVVESTGWERVEVPVFGMVGDSARNPMVQPDAVRCSTAPGEVVERTVAVVEAPSFTKMVAYVERGEQVIRLKTVVVFRPIRRSYTEEELQELPPSMRDQARREGYIEYQETARSDGSTPVPVPVEPKQKVVMYLELGSRDQSFQEKRATLVVDAPTWQRTEVPVTVVAGEVHTEISPTSLAVRQGGSGTLTATVRSVAGPATDVQFALGMGEGQWQVSPASVHVPEGQTVTVPLTVQVDPRAPVGTFAAGFETTAFDGLQFRRLPFDLVVGAAPVTVRALQPTIVAMRGETTPCPIEVVSEGGYKVLSLTPGTLPTGVHMTPVTREIGYGAEHLVIPVELSVDARGPKRSDLYTSMFWDAGDGDHRGLLQLRTTIDRRLEERTFRQEITTPSGTALGGWAELTIRSDGTSRFQGHMHDSGFDSYAFRIGVVVRSPDGVYAVAALKSGTVSGTTGSGSRDFDWDDPGRPNPQLELFWDNIRDGSAVFTKSYEDTGVLGTLEDIAELVLEFVAVYVTAGAFTAVVVVLGSELGAMAELPFAHPTALVGVIVAGGIVYLLGPGFLVPAVAAGVAAAEEVVRTRPLRPSERELATSVFGDTLPLDNILVTDLSRGSQAFCAPWIDGSILLGLGGARYDDSQASVATKKTLIHELTHAWQIAHRPASDLESIWEVVVNLFRGDDAYATSFNFDGRAWTDWEIEHQAQIVANWWEMAQLLGGIDSPAAQGLPAFQYVHNNIRMGQP